jgi:predicted amidohydrolase YtcJ
MNNKLIFNVFFVLFILAGCQTNTEKVDSIVIAPKIYLANSSFEFAEAMAIKNGKVVATGTEKEITKNYQSENISRFDGFIYPGFIDAHSHFRGYGLTLNAVNLLNTYSLEEIVEKTVAFAQTSTSAWITGRGWDQTDWTQQGMVNNTMLNIYFPDKPVFLKRIDGHAAIANAKALELAGITPQTKINGGEIEVIGGRLTGLITDNAMDMVDAVIPPTNRKSEITALLKAQENCFAAGLTCVTDAGLDLDAILLIDSLQKTGDLKIRVYAMANPSKENFEYFQKNGAIESDLLQVSSFKIYADGSLGSRGAKLKAPYCDKEGYTGVWVTNPTEIDSLCNLLDKMNFQANTHCIGDSANRRILEIYGKHLKGKNDKRWRIEHAQVVTPADRELFAKYSIIPSVQPTHATSDMPWAEQRLCNTRMDGAYAYKSLLKLNGWLPLGTDFPVEDISPLQTFYAAVYRQNKDSKPLGGFMPEESLSANEAILGMTLWAAKANRMENKIGSLEPGKLADFIVLDTDIVNEKYMLKTQVVGTYLNGVRN